MKHIKILMLAALIFITAGPLTAQSKVDKKAQMKLEKAERKKEEAKQRQENKKAILSMINDRDYVIEANTLYGKYHSRYNVTPSINFVKIEGDKVIIQSGSNVGPGYNGLGGITIEGNITSYKVLETKKDKPVQVIAQFSSIALGHSTLSISIDTNGYAKAIVNGAFGQKATFAGDFRHADQSRVFKGMSLL